MLAQAAKSAQRQRIVNGKGFIAALDQSGGSTPKALMAYGYQADAWRSEDEMFALVHAMRSRVMQSPSFTSGSILGAILFEKTLLNQVADVPTAQYLWEQASVVPFLKIDAGLADVEGAVQCMKPMPRLSALLQTAKEQGVYGTKMRSLIHGLDTDGIARVVAQQFAVAREVIAAGLVPIVEPEVDIHAADREGIEALLVDLMLAELDQLAPGQEVILKLSIPVAPDAYAGLRDHPAVQRLVALSGGFSREDACERLAQNPGMIASFSRALMEGLSAGQSDEDFDAQLASVIAQITVASA